MKPYKGKQYIIHFCDNIAKHCYKCRYWSRIDEQWGFCSVRKFQTLVTRDISSCNYHEVNNKEMKIRLFVDDQRSPKDLGLKGWVTARTSAGAIMILKQTNVVECSLDHDLGGEDTGYKVVCWMEEHNVWPKDGTRCHSANPVGKKRIETVINNANRKQTESCLRNNGG